VYTNIKNDKTKMAGKIPKKREKAKLRRLRGTVKIFCRSSCRTILARRPLLGRFLMRRNFIKRRRENHLMHRLMASLSAVGLRAGRENHLHKMELANQPEPTNHSKSWLALKVYFMQLNLTSKNT
jgi:hypothetical protein